MKKYFPALAVVFLGILIFSGCLKKSESLGHEAPLTTMWPGDPFSFTYPFPVDGTCLVIDNDDPELPRWLEISVQVEGKDAPVVVKPEPGEDGKFVVKGDALPRRIKSVTGVNKGNKAREIRDGFIRIER